MDGLAGSHAARIVAALEDDLLEGRLLPGDRLDERTLAERFGVSRTPVREALQRLAANGIAAMSARQTASVIQLDVADLLDCFEIIAEFEAIAAAQAARRITPAQRLTLEQANREAADCARAGDAEAFNRANTRFHAAITEASHNRILRAQIRTPQILTAPYRRQVTFLAGRMAASIEEHQDITDAILRNDPATAAVRMRRHVNHLAESIGDFLHSLRGSPLDDRRAAAQPRVAQP